MFNKILIANRGEIACRIIKTARSMGIHSVAVYSSVDKDSAHVQQADSAYCIGEASAKDSYLNIQAIIQVAKDSGAQAIHPGYGFLSENPLFAKACADADIIFIGPSISAMEAMASKQLAKQLLEQTNVPLTPGYHGQEQSEAQLLEHAKAIGFPILLKAANGGGGKGMRAVYHIDEFQEALAGAKRESKASFADDTMIIEKLVQEPRHVEVQIMADNYGNVVHLFERDCSIQRRHQKIIEEAPAPNLSSQLRQRLAQAACEVARSIQYRGAGTIEFLVDKNEQFYFMEMNTRLQVEHPVTEMITGLDLVAWQLNIAANNPLPLTQEDIRQHGHAIECRIYAEDPHQGFIPSIGCINFLQEPDTDGVRIDTGIQLGSSITMYYDPMIAKLITTGNNRQEALQRMQQALAHYHIGGVKTNIPFLHAICQHPHFAGAQLSTDFLTKEHITLDIPDQHLALLMTASFDYIQTISALNDALLADTFAWHHQQTNHWLSRYQFDEQLIEIQIMPMNQHEMILGVDGVEHCIRVCYTHPELTIEWQQKRHTVVVDNTPEALTLYTRQGPINIQRHSWNQQETQGAHTKGQLTAPMPATVVAILKKEGDIVKAGERLLVLEAMKMEHSIHAPHDGILEELFYSVGAQVHEGAELLSLK